MKMVIHEAISMAKPIVAFIDPVQSYKEIIAISVISVNRLLFIPSGGDMVDSPWIFDS